MLKLTDFCIIESNNVQLLYKMFYLSIWLDSNFYIRLVQTPFVCIRTVWLILQ